VSETETSAATGPRALSAEAMAEFEQLCGRYPKKRAVLLPLLRILEREFGCVDRPGMELAARLIGMTPAEVESVVTFYTHYKRESDGRYVIWVCNTLPCALRGATEMTDALERKLGVRCWETTADGKFTLKKAECLAACHTAPCFQIDDDQYENVTEEQLDGILGRYE
jgi:NADH-quinone oxidoreductase E subunit